MSAATHIEATKSPRSSIDGFGNVLVATDFTDGAKVALERAAGLPFAPGAQVQLTHVVETADPRAVVQRRLEEERQRLFEGSQARVLTSILEGDVAPALALRARHSRTELVVLGRHGTRSWREAVLGTTAHRVIRDGSTSTLIVAPRAIGAYRRPLVAVDFSPSSTLALELSARISAPGTPICVVHVISPLDDVLVETTQLERFLHGVELPISWQPTVQIGDPAEQILEAARQRDSDLIVVGSIGKGLVRRALLGSVAERVMRGASCDVLVARLPEVRM